MTYQADRLRAIAVARESMTPADIAARAQALRLRTQAKLAQWAEEDQILGTIQNQIDQAGDDLDAAQAALAPAQSTLASEQSAGTSLQAQIVQLQAQLALGGPPATAEDIAERDEITALLAELGIS